VNYSPKYCPSKHTARHIQFLADKDCIYICLSFPVPIYFLYKLIKPSEYFIMPFQATNVPSVCNDDSTLNLRAYLFPGFNTQWFSSGKITSRLGIPNLYTQVSIEGERNTISAAHSCKTWKAPMPSVSGRR